MFDLYPDVEPALADPNIHPAMLDAAVPDSTTNVVSATSATATRVRAAIGRRLIAAGAALLPDEPIRRPVVRP